MTIRTWVLARIRDDDKHAELEAREVRSNQVADDLREERLRNGFGRMFGEAGLGVVPPKAHKKGRHA